MGKAGLNKLNRFNKGFAVKQAEEQHFGGNYFDQSYLEADRILYCTEIFSIIHPKKSRGIKHKWYEHLPEVLS
jgi:chromodomain-helicase-DNA-binding protein 7